MATLCADKPMGNEHTAANIHIRQHHEGLSHARLSLVKVFTYGADKDDGSGESAPHREVRVGRNIVRVAVRRVRPQLLEREHLMRSINENDQRTNEVTTGLIELID
jgi:hypothetical protein